jgi:hypothetical protein
MGTCLQSDSEAALYVGCNKTGCDSTFQKTLQAGMSYALIVSSASGRFGDINLSLVCEEGDVQGLRPGWFAQGVSLRLESSAASVSLSPIARP